MNEEIKEEIVQSETPITGDVEQQEEKKGDDIYVENDPNDLERMLGIAPSEEIEVEGEECDNVLDPENDSNKENDTTEDQEDVEIENLEVTDKERPLLLSDFMVEDKDQFNYLVHEKYGNDYHIISLPLNDRKSIKSAVKSPDYVFRYPKYLLKDKVLGFEVEESGKDLYYKVFFPEYILFFTVNNEYVKPYSVSFKDYFEDLVSRVRPMNMEIQYFKNSVTVKAIKVLETGLLEVTTDEGVKNFLLVNPSISFYNVLGYIRELSDLGEDTLTLSLLPEFFEEV